MKINKVHCLFEQSGTFKNEFIKLGIPAEDYDILNDFKQTDNIIDIFDNINKAYDGKPSLFDKIPKDDLVFAFFPCTRFENQIQLWFRGDCCKQRNWSDMKKIIYAMGKHEELAEMYRLFSRLVYICIERQIRLIIENPYNEQHYMRKFFPIKASLVDSDRRLRGDYYQKPTQYWFINCEPENNYIDETVNIKPKKTIGHTSSKVDRSLISPDYANRFIREFILDGKKRRQARIYDYINVFGNEVEYE